jgi:hypothetical protein
MGLRLDRKFVIDRVPVLWTFALQQCECVAPNFICLIA